MYILSLSSLDLGRVEIAVPMLRYSDGLFCYLCFFSGDVAACTVSSGEESRKIRIYLPMMVSWIGQLLYLAAGLAVVIVLWPRHGVHGEIFCFSTSSFVVVFVGGGLVSTGINFVTNDMVGV